MPYLFPAKGLNHLPPHLAGDRSTFPTHSNQPSRKPIEFNGNFIYSWKSVQITAFFSIFCCRCTDWSHTVSAKTKRSAYLPEAVSLSALVSRSHIARGKLKCVSNVSFFHFGHWLSYTGQDNIDTEKRTQPNPARRCWSSCCCHFLAIFLARAPGIKTIFILARGGHHQNGFGEWL